MSRIELAYSLLVTAALLVNGLAVAGGTPVRELLAPLRERRLLASALLLDLVVVPTALLVPAALLGSDPGTLAGLVILAAASAGPIGVALTRIARADIATSVALVSLLGVANLITTPLLMTLLLPTALHVPALELGRSLLLLLVLPLAAGVLLRRTLLRRRWHPERTARLIRRLGATSSLLLAGAVTVGFLIDPRAIVRDVSGPPALAGLAMLVVTGGVIGLLGLDRRRARSLWLVTSARSVGVGLAIVAIHLPDTLAARTSVLAIGGLTQALPLLVLLALARWERRRAQGASTRRGRLTASEERT